MQGKRKVSLKFGLYEGGQLVRRETVTQDIVKVGKDQKSHLRVDDEVASGMQAVIEVASPDDITLIDLGNEPGTIVNGARINKCKIQPGDQIQIGSTLIMLERADVAAVSGPPRMPATQMGMGAPQQQHYSSPPQYNAPPPPPAPQANPFAAQAFANPNPFAQGAYGVAHDAPAGSYTYTLIKSGPDVNPDEVELGHVTAVEVMILWETTVLHVKHLTPPRSFYVGEEEGKNYQCDYFIPSEKIGTTRAPIVLADHGSISFVILPRARGTVEIPGQPKMTLEDAVRSGRTQPCAELSGAQQMALPSGGKARMEIDGLVFQVAAVPAGRPLVHGLFATSDFNTLLYVGLSLLAHVGLIAAMAFFVPP